jgi:site-specific DNA-cytosine methylase
MTAFGEYADDNTASTLKQRDYKDATDLVAQTFSVPAIGSIIEDKVSSCITRHTGAGAGETQNPSYVLEPKAHAFKVRGGSEVETGEQGGTPGKKAGKGYLGQDEKVFTIGTTQDQQIAQPIPIHDQATRHSGKRGDNQDGKGNGLGIGKPGDPMNTLTKGDNHAVAQPIPFRKTKRATSKDDYETWLNDEVSNTLNTFDLTGDVRTINAVAQPIAVDCYNQTVNEKTSQTIGSSASDVNHYGAVLQPIVENENYFEPNPFNDTFVYKGINHGRTQEGNSVKILSELRKKIGTKAFAQWGLGVFNTLQSTQILQSDLHGIDVRPATFSNSRFIYGSLSLKENDSSWLLQSLRESGCEGCSPQGWELSEQLHRELGAYLSQLPYEKPQSKRFLHDLWEADERIGLLRQALSKVQKIWRPTHGESKSTSHPYAIRRLTPFETEILQGFPRGWTKIPYRNKSADQCPDGPRYKACGNSMAVPVMRWIGERIQMVEQLMKEINENK